MNVIKGKTRTGFSYKIDKDILDDYELLEVMSSVDESPLKFPKLLTMLLGEEQKASLIEHIRSKNKRVPITAMQEEIMDIFSGTQEVKNSSSSPE
ncbi:hypothetical protein K5I04_04910 [Murdochiella sp. Marseille-P8839]|nr:hypothetical protein [Murdochiella sp. Marseille-P8839]